ncbi:hypothetical protein [Streptomyces wuyuanensis]|uniref:Heavy-metal-associated domain-containing protein n=1 Tax=Streptomyces wuyuanensis TaxID=1196353 RepID=A0A1G9N649_9ACTN|nr:hypothetical protein [Streptomyces wuyuanensis]SDL82016.1 hypothetical protein SAMN05444921_101500 [Streptomyces wuyuanensis]
MHTIRKIGAFGAALAASFGAAYGLGAAVGPAPSGPAPGAHAPHDAAGPGGGEARAARPGAAPAGLQVSEGGYTLDLKTPRVTAGRTADLRFAVRDASGRQVTAFERDHGKELHLIVVSRDLLTYRHLHPVRAADGTWGVPVTLPAAGGYRVFADFTPAAEGAGNLTLGAELAAAGPYAPPPAPGPNSTATVDGYTVTLTGGLRPGAPGGLRLNVARDGRPVTDLEPYLGAYGHLVALRSGDLAYLHVHPDGEPDDGRTRPGPGVSFTATAPSPGTYRLFLDFKHKGTVRTAAFTVRAGVAAVPGTDTPRPPSAPAHDGAAHAH